MRFKIPSVRLRKTRRPEPDSPPGTLLVSPDLPAGQCHLSVYDADGFEERDLPAAELAGALVPVPGKVLWLDVQGLGDQELVQTVGSLLGLHPLTVEDLVHLHQRPKLEEFDDHLFVVLRMVRLLPDGSVDNEQLSLILKEGLLVTFQERPGDGFDPVRRRLREGKGQIRRQGADYLAYALMDAVIDNYYPVLDAFADSMDRLDDAVMEGPNPDLSSAIHAIRHELRQLRRAVWPLREVVNLLSHHDGELVATAVQPAFRDCYDHVIQASDIIDSARERATELSDLHLQVTSERTNQVMKVLTIIATVFIPLTFLCGVYGMNFSDSPYNMPELHWRYGYIAFWIVTVLVVIGQIWYFGRKGWLGREPK